MYGYYEVVKYIYTTSNSYIDILSISKSALSFYFHFS